MIENDVESEVVPDELEAIWRLASSLSNALSAPKVAETLCGEGGPAVGGSFIRMALLAREPGLVRLYSAVSPDSVEMSVTTCDLGDDTPVCEAIRSGLPVLLGSVAEVGRRFPHLLAEMRSSGLLARATVPLSSGEGEILGAIGFGWPEPQAFTAGQLRRLQLIGQLCGLALERSAETALPGRVHGAKPAALETMPSAFFSLDGELRISYMNAEAERVLGRRREEVLDRLVYEAFPDLEGSVFEDRYRELTQTGEPIVFDALYEPLGRWFEVHAWPDGAGLNVALWDIDERRATDRRRTVALDQAEEENSRLAFLAEVSVLLSGAPTQAEVLNRLARAVVPSMADWCTIVVPEGESLVRVAAVHRDPVLDRLAKQLVGSYPHAFSGPSPGVVVYKSGRPLRLKRLAKEIVEGLDDSASSAAYGRTLMLLGDGAGLIMPVHRRGEVVAVLTMVRSDGSPFPDADMGILNEVCVHASVAIDHALHVEAERATAAALQAAALPRSLPTGDRVLIEAGYRTASEGSQVGGDWYDAFELPNGHLALAVGDAAGHGLKAAAVMAQMRNALRAYLFESLGPKESLARLRRFVATQEPDSFATIVCVELDPLSGEAIWVSAGHPAPILVRADGSSVHLRGEISPPIGWASMRTPQVEYEQQLRIEESGRMVLFTDGLVERRDADIDVGLAHLQILAERTRGESADSACRQILDGMLPEAHDDDACILVVDFR